ncbi:hypothetical protein ANO14919_046550 [Xylariales sp. No.14919]|nr:hypothetical protein ANO14919_046550 [Xylariales sp. No.14919]
MFSLTGSNAIFNAPSSQPTQPFTPNTVSLIYTNTRSFSGRVGMNNPGLKWDNGLDATGGLNVRDVYPPNTANSSGGWEQA